MVGALRDHRLGEHAEHGQAGGGLGRARAPARRREATSATAMAGTSGRLRRPFSFAQKLAGRSRHFAGRSLPARAPLARHLVGPFHRSIAPRPRPADRNITALPTHHRARTVPIRNLCEPCAVEALAKMDRELTDDQRVGRRWKFVAHFAFPFALSFTPGSSPVVNSTPASSRAFRSRACW